MTLPEAQQMTSRFVARAFRLLPTNLISRAWGRITRTSASKHLIVPFSKLFSVETDEAQMDARQYPNLNAFFTRKLRPESRPVDTDPKAIVCPVDGRVSAHGDCDQDRLIQVKGVSFSLFALLRDSAMAKRFEHGNYTTLYLSPRDYHRIHAPLDLKIHAMGYMPGNLLPVNPPSVRWIPGLYTQNERICLYATSQVGQVAMVLVGAHCVGSIRLTFNPFTTNRPGVAPTKMNFERPVSVHKGMELGVFELGSSVLLLFEKKYVQLELPAPGTPVRMGQRIGTMLRTKPKRRTPRKNSKKSTAKKKQEVKP